MAVLNIHKPHALLLLLGFFVGGSLLPRIGLSQQLEDLPAPAIAPQQLESLPIQVPSTRLQSPFEVRIKDITYIEGQRTNRFTGMGLVTGLDGTGGKNPATRQFALSMLERFGQRADPNLRNRIRTDALDKTDNLAVVTVTAEVDVSNHRVGNQIDVIVSAFDDASSLQGGVLISTPLYGYDGEVYVLAGGPISIGGFSFSGDAASVQKNHPTTGRVSRGGTVEKSICKEPFAKDGRFVLNLHDPDLTNSTRIANAINQVWLNSARVISDESVEVFIPRDYMRSTQHFAALVESIRITPDVEAKVVINERTGTVVIGENVRLSPVAITHANLAVITGESPIVSQPAPFSDGSTVVVPRTDINVSEEKSAVNVIPSTVTVGELARALNSLGVTPRDLSSIFQLLKSSGALHAELQFQ